MSFVKKLSLRKKLTGLCGFFLLSIGLVGTASNVQLTEVVENYDRVSEIYVQKLTRVYQMMLAFRQVRIDLRTLGLQDLSAQQYNNAVTGALNSVEVFKKAKKDFDNLPEDLGQKPIREKMEASWTKFEKVGERILGLQKSGQPGDVEKMRQIFLNDCPEAANEFRLANLEMIDFIEKQTEQHVLSARSAAKASTQFISIVLALSILLGIGMGWIFSAALAKSIGQVIDKINLNSTTVSSAATQIASSSQALAQAVSEQAASLQETASSVEELSSMVEKNSSNSKAAAKSSETSRSKAQEGQQAVTKMIESMEEIHTSNQNIIHRVNASNTQLTEIVTVIQSIGEKTKVINDIVFQTKLLSFNASVEAARAGEQGKGFSVVAEEVGKLAQMSGNAAKEITNMLAGSIQKVESIVQNTKTEVELLISQGKEKVESGVQVAQQCAQVLGQIVENVSNVSEMAVEISQASEEQSRGIHEINKAMAQLDSVTQQNSGTTQEASQAADSLSVQALSLSETIQDLKDLVYGSLPTTSKEAGALHPIRLKVIPPENTYRRTG